MSRIHSRNTKIETLVLRYLFARGLRYRKNDKRYPGKPDAVFPKYRTVLFINGCFWHYHDTCSVSKMPKSNLAYWQPKLENNRKRDEVNIKALCADGWNVITVWECELKKSVRDERLIRLYEEITT
jgi:DNA mismatch endonuclease (patch repair protein)